MSPINNLGVLAFASAVLAVPHAHAHEHNHRHLHERQDLGSVTGGVSSLLSGKKGIAYNDASDALPFASAAGFGWAFNWVSNSAGLTNTVSYIPTLHNGESEFLDSWSSDAQAAIDAGAKYLFGFNEPDIASQANLQPGDAASLWKQYMEPFAGKATLVAPAVSNSNNPGEGLEWLSAFMAACSGCNIGAVNQHWYDSTGNDMGLFQQQISAAHSQTGLPVFVGEFGFIGSDSDISSAISQATSWMDSQDSVIGYAYFMAASGYLLDGTTPSPYGLTYIGGS